MLLADRLTLSANPGGLVQDKSHKRDKFARLALSDEQKNKVVYTRLTDNSSLSDYRPSHEHPWVQQYVEHEKINVVDEDGTVVHANSEDGKSGVSHAAGIILTFHGRPARTVALDPANRDVLSLEVAEMREEAFSTRFPRFTEWHFCLHEVIYTDGPERNARLHEAAEDARARQEEKSLASQEAFYTKMMSVLTLIAGQIQKSGGQVDMDALVKEASGGALDGENFKTDNEDLAASLEVWSEIDGDPAPKGGSGASVEVEVSKGSDKKSKGKN